MNKIILPLLITFALACSCENSNEPNVNHKDPRDFTWRADTIYYPDSYQTIVQSTWATSENDIYAVAHTDVNEGAFWHYDGTKWEMIRIFDHIERGVLSFNKIFGLSDSQIWIAGNRGTQSNTIPVIWVYNGYAIFETRIDGYGGRLQSIHGTDRNNIWACGDSGLIAQYDGLQWKTEKINHLNLNLDALWLDDIAVDDERVYATGGGIDNSSRRGKSYFFENKENSWSISDSSIIEPYGHVPKWGYRHLYMSSWHTIYSHTHGLFKLASTGWQRVTDFFDNKATRDMSGTSENNMIIVGDYSKAYHWNGTESILITELELDDISSFNCVELFDKEAFIFGHTNSFPQKTVVYHGK
ncbi:MAG: hypothetical protein KKA84_12535 [Bacteroidetes bacterium]|nr:hypothetical protein [Bacteroidota bacterium]